MKLFMQKSFANFSVSLQRMYSKGEIHLYFEVKESFILIY